MVQQVIGVEAVANILVPEITALGEDTQVHLQGASSYAQWRVKLAVIDQIPLLGKTLGADAFDARLTPLTLV